MCAGDRMRFALVTVSCPEELQKSESFVFSALVESKRTQNQTPSFYWKLNAGRIVKGQYSREMEATTTGANGFEGITATVEVRGFDPSCIATGSCTTKIIW
jgi:hypothetical protein